MLAFGVLLLDQRIERAGSWFIGLDTVTICSVHMLSADIPKYCVSQFRKCPPESFGGPAGQNRIAEAYHAELPGIIIVNWEWASKMPARGRG